MKGRMFVAIAGLVLFANPVWSYEEVPVTNGGTLTGIVTLQGDVPNPKGYNLVTFPDPVYCGRISDGKGWRILQPFTVDAQGGFQNVVVLVEGIKEGKPFNNTTKQIEAIDCKFAPYITVVRNHQKVKVVNKDPVMHDIQAYETSKFGARVLFNVPLPVSDRLQRRKKDLLEGKHIKNRVGRAMTQLIKMRKGRNVFVMQCGFHAYMESWGLAVKSPYFAISGKDGSYAINDIPPGTYKVAVWHPMFTQEYTVTIRSGETSQLAIPIEAPKGRLYANEAQEHTRFGMELLGGSKIVPIVELQKH
ncbi:MAG: carboxypeptidase-like regulatory domain-containing protein [Nitrospirae bacterium]|nr:carboxypeptidase-like regulatory domain-containing protein [Nitrospirota bacterium]